MTVIKFETTSMEYKRGFKAAMKMILKCCERRTYKNVDELEDSLRAGIMLDDLIEEGKLK